MIKPTTKTVIGTISTLMVLGMIVSFVNGTETYYHGREVSLRTRVPVRSSIKSEASYMQASILSAGTEKKITVPKVQPIKARQTVAPMIPLSCEAQHLYTYTGKDQNGVFVGSCIPCEMNKFNVQTKACGL